MPKSSTFRWNFIKQEQLGTLIKGTKETNLETFPDVETLLEEIRLCSAKILSQSANGSLVFVGRSPESLFDYLNGALAHTASPKRCTLLNFSMRFMDDFKRFHHEQPHSIKGIRKQFSSVGLTPSAILASKQPTVFVDLVCYGGTFENLVELLLIWAAKTKENIPELKKKMHFLGITMREKSSPNAYRWWQDGNDWTKEFSVRSISVDPYFWRYLGGGQPKVGQNNNSRLWAEETLLKVPKSRPERAIQLANQIVQSAKTRTERKLLAREMANQSGMNHPWFRSLLSEIRTK